MLNLQILIVDDHATVREASRFVFTAAGMHRLVEATSSAEAIAIVRHSQLDLVLLDVVLRDGRGLQALEEIKGISPSLPVLVHSFDDNPRLMASSFQLGAAGYVIKGLDKNLLIQAVRRAARGESTWTPAEMELIRQADADSPPLWPRRPWPDQRYAPTGKIKPHVQEMFR